MADNPHSAELLAIADGMQHDLQIYMEGVVHFIGRHPELTKCNPTIVHSYRARLKSMDSLKEKLERKAEKGIEVTPANFSEQVTDLAGVRILHLFQGDFGKIDTVIRKKIDCGDWVLGERPKVFTWDPEAAEFFKQFDLALEIKPSFYTSVHYLVRPRAGSPLCCEIQVRTLFEEIWGEVDHQINYPIATSDVACTEQLKVLSKLVGAGSRLLDALRRVHFSSKQAAL